MEKVILDLPLMFVWYDMIDEGEKPEEYREYKSYWINRLCDGIESEDHCQTCNYLHEVCAASCIEDDGKDPCQRFTHVRFRRGYTKTTMLFEIKNITIGFGNPKWGAPKDRKVFIIKLGKRIYDS